MPLSWAQAEPGYTGPLGEHYEGGLEILRDAHAAAIAGQQKAATLVRRAHRLTIVAAILAAAAGITALPEEIGRIVAAVIAFFAAVVSGYVAATNPSRAAAHEHGRGVQLLQLRDETKAYLRLVRTLPDDAASRGRLDVRLAELQAQLRSIVAQSGL